MSQRSHRRRVLLFCVAVLVPSLVLVALSLRMIEQERELAEKRIEEERHRLVQDVRQVLLARLEGIRSQEVRQHASRQPGAEAAAYGHPEVVLVSWVEENRLLLPWEEQPNADRSRGLTGEETFARHIQQGEYAELAQRQFARAAGSYREAVGVARHPAQEAYARLLLARALDKAGHLDEANAQHGWLLEQPSGVADDLGIPFALYAAGRLLAANTAHAAVLERVRAEVAARPWLAPAPSYVLRDLTEALIRTAPDTAARNAALDLQYILHLHVRRLEQAQALQASFSGLIHTLAFSRASPAAEPLWISFGEDPWLVNLTPALGDVRPVAVAVRAQDVFDALEAAYVPPPALPTRIHLSVGSTSEGEPLGPGLPGVRVAFEDRGGDVLARRWHLQRYFYLVVLLLILGLTLFGASLLWHDMRRELHLAELRAQFVSSVSHELKTPLTAIRMFAETLRLRRSPDPQMQAEYLDTIISESERLTRLLNNVLDFSKIEQGKKHYHLVPASLPEIVRTAARAVQYPLSQQGFALRADVADDLPAAQVDADALQQAILNLITNAMKFSGESRKIDLRLHRQNGEALIEVTDYGLGIAPDEQKRIFEKFYRVPTPETQQISGTGLGLTLVEHIARAHGGRVTVRSTPGQGSTFTLFLPCNGGLS